MTAYVKALCTLVGAGLLVGVLLGAAAYVHSKGFIGGVRWTEQKIYRVCQSGGTINVGGQTFTCRKSTAT